MLRISLRLLMFRRTFNSIFMHKISQQCWISCCSNLNFLIEIVYFNCFNSLTSDLMSSISLDCFFMIDFLITINFFTLLMKISFLITMNNEITVNKIKVAAMQSRNFINILCSINNCLYLINFYKLYLKIKNHHLNSIRI